MLRWSSGRPTRPGWYFFRDKIHTSNLTTVVRVLRLEGTRVSHVVFSIRDQVELEHLGACQFAGPVEEPVEETNLERNVAELLRVVHPSGGDKK